MGGEVVATRAEVGDFAEFADRAVPAVRGRDEGLKVNELVRTATFAIRTGDIFGLRQSGGPDAPAVRAGVLGGAGMLSQTGVLNGGPCVVHGRCRVRWRDYRMDSLRMTG